MHRSWTCFAISLLCCALGGLARARAAGQPTADRRRPNIVVILCDDMGFSDLGCYGSEIHTPNLDALAAGGLRFTQFYNTSRCCPSRASLLTGLYPHQAGMGYMTNGRIGSDGYTGNFNSHCVTIAQVLKPAGYATYMVGKWHVTSDDKPGSPKNNWPVQRGFDKYYGTIIGASSYFDPGMLTRDNTVISPFTDREYQPRAGEPYYFTNALSDQAARYITEHHQRHPEQPFFAYVAYTAPHFPMQALGKDVAKYKRVYDAGYGPIRAARFKREKALGLINPAWDLSPQAGDWDAVKNKAWESRCMEVYAAMVDNMDQGVGRIVESLRTTGQLDDTLILFLQDNGGNYEDIGRDGNSVRAATPSLPAQGNEFFETSERPDRTRDGWPMLHGETVMPGPADTFIAYGRGWGNVSNTPFREYKHFVHEGGIATPLIAHWPVRIARKGQLERQPGHLLDLMATCVEVAGAKYPETFNGNAIVPMQGKSLVPVFDGQTISRDAIYWEHEGNRAVRQGKWKLVAKYPTGAWELYDIEADRTEMHDLASAQPERTRAMVQKWEAWARDANVIPWPWKPQYGEPPRQVEQTVFKLNQGDDLHDENVPQVGGKAIRISATVDARTGDGVILAQGGHMLGYSLYIKAGRAAFALRRQNVLTLITSKEPVPGTPFDVSADLEHDGTISLGVNGTQVATGNAAGVLSKTPADGLQVGQDGNNPVGEYVSPFAFQGTLSRVVLRLNAK